MEIFRVPLIVAMFCILSACDGPWDDGYTALGKSQQAAVDKFIFGHAGLGAAGPKDRLILCSQADLNNDGIPDVVLIYAPAKGTSPVPEHDGKAMCVLVSTPQGYVTTNSLPAPFERQTIQYRDIDEKPPLEFIVSGFKGAKSGLGVYRIYGEKVVNLFGESMDECC